MSIQYFYEATTQIDTIGIKAMSNKPLQNDYTHGTTGNILDGVIHIPPEENINHPSRYTMGRGIGISNPLGTKPYEAEIKRRVQQDFQNAFKLPETLAVDLSHVLANEYATCKIMYQTTETLVLNICGKEHVFTAKQHGDTPVSIGNSTEPQSVMSILLIHILEDRSKKYSFRMELLTGKLLVDIDGIGLGDNE